MPEERSIVLGNRKLTPTDVIRVRMFEMPEDIVNGLDDIEHDYGEFEWSFGGVKFKIDLLGLRTELKNSPFKFVAEDVISRVLNFRKVYLVIPTMEIMT